MFMFYNICYNFQRFGSQYFTHQKIRVNYASQSRDYIGLLSPIPNDKEGLDRDKS